MNELEFTRFLTTYYRQPQPGRVPEALAWYATSSMGLTRASTGPMAYFFVRVVHMCPAMIAHYRTVRGRVPMSGAAFIDHVLDLISRCPSGESLRFAMRGMTSCEAASVRAVRAAMPFDTDSAVPPKVLTSLEMDCLWAEFCTTGDTEAVLSIIAVLDWPDLVRCKLDDWLSSNARISPIWLSRWRRNGLLRRLGLTFDEATGRVGSLEDVDCFCATESLQLSSERFTKVRAALPFELTEDEQTYIAVKAVAKWSLWSNAAQHSRILQLCRRQVDVGSRRTRISLAEIIRAGGHGRFTISLS